jgi:hypothetical protein
LITDRGSSAIEVEGLAVIVEPGCPCPSHFNAAMRRSAIIIRVAWLRCIGRDDTRCGRRDAIQRLFDQGQSSAIRYVLFSPERFQRRRFDINSVRLYYLGVISMY